MTGTQIWLALCTADSHLLGEEVVNTRQDLRRSKTDPPVGFGVATLAPVVLLGPENPARVIEL